MKYKIVYGEKKKVEEEVRKLSTEGWVCQGGVAVSTIGEVVQAMIRIEEWW